LGRFCKERGKTDEKNKTIFTICIVEHSDNYHDCSCVYIIAVSDYLEEAGALFQQKSG
jgi:hypothetical protein